MDGLEFMQIVCRGAGSCCDLLCHEVTWRRLGSLGISWHLVRDDSYHEYFLYLWCWNLWGWEVRFISLGLCCRCKVWTVCILVRPVSQWVYLLLRFGRWMCSLLSCNLVIHSRCDHGPDKKQIDATFMESPFFKDRKRYGREVCLSLSKGAVTQ